MNVRVVLFGRAADQLGERELTLELPTGATLRQAAEVVVRQYPVLAWITTASRPARNLEYGSWEDPVEDGDELSFIPPVSGG